MSKPFMMLKQMLGRKNAQLLALRTALRKWVATCAAKLLSAAAALLTCAIATACRYEPEADEGGEDRITR